MAITQFHIQNPCNKVWSKMSPTEKGVFCSSCQKEVYDLTNLSRKEIKSVVEKESDLCVRVQQYKLDELNFIEWFNHLKLRKQLKYLFLFSFHIVLSNQAISQDSTLIQPQYIELDKEDEVSFQEIISNNEYQLALEEIPVTEIEDYQWSQVLTMEDWGFPIITSGMMGSILATEDRYQGDDGFYDLVPYKNQISIQENAYQFEIVDDSLIFSINAQKEQEIQLKITKDLYSLKPYPFKNTVYFQPILIHPGQQTISLSLKEFANGSYTVRINSGKGSGAIKLMYW